MTKSLHTYCIYVGYILGTPLILTHNRLSIGFSLNASWCRILYVNCDFLQKPQTHFWGIFPLRLWTVLQLKVANPCDLLKQKFLFPKMLCTNRYRERKLRLSIIHVSHSSFISSWEVKASNIINLVSLQRNVNLAKVKKHFPGPWKKYVSLQFSINMYYSFML